MFRENKMLIFNTLAVQLSIVAEAGFRAMQKTMRRHPSVILADFATVGTSHLRM